MSELAQTISLYRAGQKDAAEMMVQSDAGLVAMGKLRKLMDEMLQEETALETVRIAAYRSSVRGTIVSIYLASVLAAFGLVLLAFYILREMELREKHAAQIRHREEWYRVTLTSIGDGVIATDERGTRDLPQSLAERLTGTTLDEGKGRPSTMSSPSSTSARTNRSRIRCRKVMELGKVIGLANHTTLRHKNGTTVPDRGQRRSHSR